MSTDTMPVSYERPDGVAWDAVQWTTSAARRAGCEYVPTLIAAHTWGGPCIGVLHQPFGAGEASERDASRIRSSAKKAVRAG